MVDCPSWKLESSLHIQRIRNSGFAENANGIQTESYAVLAPDSIPWRPEEDLSSVYTRRMLLPTDHHSSMTSFDIGSSKFFSTG